MKSELYESNMGLLEKYHPHTWKFMHDLCPMPAGEVFESASGKLNLRVSKEDGMAVPLHDEVDPDRRAYDFLKAIPEDFRGLVVVLGMGLAYVPLVLIRKRPLIRHLALFELDPGIFQQALLTMDLSSLLSDNRLILSVGPDPEVSMVLENANQDIVMEGYYTIKHPGSFSLNIRGYQKLYEGLFSSLNIRAISAATIRIHGNKMMGNCFKNLASIHHHHLLEDLKGVFDGIPAIIVAAGPSLDKNIEDIVWADGRAVIFSADSALPPLIRKGISPQFVTAIDYQDIVYEKIAGLEAQAKGASLICIPSVAPKVPKEFPAENIFWAFSKNSIDAWINRGLEGSLSIPAPSTVAHLNLIAARVMGCSPIILVGQDLSFSGPNSHAKGVSLSTEGSAGNLLKLKNQTILVKGIDGKMLPTTFLFHSYKKLFELLIRDNPCHYINATEGGVNIEGTEILGLKETIERYCGGRFDVANRIKAAVQETASRWDSLNRQLSHAQRKISDLREIIRKANKRTHRLKIEVVKMQKGKKKPLEHTAFPERLRQQLQQIDFLQSRMDKAKIDGAVGLWPFLEGIVINGVKQALSMRQDLDVLKRAPERYAEWLQKHLEWVDYVNGFRKDALDIFNAHISMVLERHKIEGRLLDDMERNNQKGQTVFDLAHLYYKWGDLTSAAPLFEKYTEISGQSAEACFYLGAIALRWSEYKKAAECFKKAIHIDSNFKGRIDELRRKIGEEYLADARKFYSTNAYDISRRMVFKSLRYCANYKEIENQLNLQIERDMEVIQTAIDSGRTGQAEDLIALWSTEIERNEGLSSCLDPQKKSYFFSYHGKLLISSGSLERAVEKLKQALLLLPNDPDLHILIMEAYFSKADFPSGFSHLKEAIKSDKSYAKYWGAIGNTLKSSGDIEGAISAYEQGFVYLPEEMTFLKKIGDCYCEMGKLKAAREAYAQVLQAVGDSS